MHHRTYDRIGKEEETDLQVLCDECHAERHDIDEDRQAEKAEVESLMRLMRESQG